MPFIKKRVLHNHYSWISLPIICLDYFVILLIARATSGS